MDEPIQKGLTAKSLICCAFAAMALASLLVVFVGSKFMTAIPCVAGSTCDEVAKLRLSNPFGIPLSLVGAIVATLNLISSIGLKRLRLAISNVTVFTGLVSICLQIYVRSSLQLNCIWCLLAAFSLVVSGSLNRSLKPRISDLYVHLSAISLIGAGVFLVAQVMSANKAARTIMFTNPESARLINMAKGRKYIVFSCVSCPACKTMYDLILRRPIVEDTKFSYLDVHKLDHNFDLQSHFNLLLEANNIDACYKFLDEIGKGQLVSVPKVSESELQDLIDQQNAAVDLKIRATPTVVEIVDPEHAVEVPMNQYLLR
jgi:uncharacterized membrane protein